MQLHPLPVRHLPPGEENPADKQINRVGDPTIYLKKGTWYLEPFVGEMFEVSHRVTGQRYVYLVKEFVDGWWKLEWPD